MNLYFVEAVVVKIGTIEAVVIGSADLNHAAID
jgi:hypothetical protein